MLPADAEFGERVDAAPFSVGQSERLPMMIATGGAFAMWGSRKGAEYRRPLCAGNRHA